MGLRTHRVRKRQTDRQRIHHHAVGRYPLNSVNKRKQKHIKVTDNNNKNARRVPPLKIHKSQKHARPKTRI